MVGAGMGETYEAAALQDRDVLSDGVDLPDISPAPQEVARKSLQVGQLDGRRRVREQRRSPARDQGEKQIPLLQRLDKLLYLSSRLYAPLVGLGMGGENGLEVLRTSVVAVFGNDEPAGDLLPEKVPRGIRHRSRGLARRDHEHPLGREALPFDDDGAVFQIQRTPDGPLGVGRGQTGRPYLLQVLPHGTIVTGSGC